ncbi:hypothetical protein ABZ816_33635 [Actinosynnema sp. NPDC047251]|uniref:hypothetical protein n=1 Tax=Saccharothrix espanaensis TaxID=103731 RepID=UPI00059C3B13|nr:hypothetical protein [Saccharothrix espanaensis]
MSEPVGGVPAEGGQHAVAVDRATVAQAGVLHGDVHLHAPFAGPEQSVWFGQHNPRAQQAGGNFRDAAHFPGGDVRQAAVTVAAPLGRMSHRSVKRAV